MINLREKEFKRIALTYGAGCRTKGKGAGSWGRLRKLFGVSNKETKGRHAKAGNSYPKGEVATVRSVVPNSYGNKKFPGWGKKQRMQRRGPRWVAKLTGALKFEGKKTIK